ncbi:hypothetical protein JOM56_011244 [Amanita muscaria]
MPTTAYLEDLPTDVLKRIAYLTSSHDLNPPSDLRALLLSNSCLYKKLNLQAAPDLYSRLFQIKFDSTCSWRPGLTDSEISLEFVQRFKVLRRAQFDDISDESLCEDLWAALWMALENNGKNESHLSLSGFPTYATSLARHYLRRDVGRLTTESCSKVQAIIVCLLCYMFTREKLANTPQKIREELLHLLQPFATTSTPGRDLPGEVYVDKYLESPSVHHRPPSQNDTSTVLHSLNEPSVYHVVQEGLLASTALKTLLFRPLTSAIILIFVMKELAPLQIPPHLPETRALARSVNRTGPTVRDFEATERCRTPLLADLRKLRAINSSGMNLLHDPEIFMLAHAKTTSAAADITPYLPGMLTGVWEGSYLVSRLEGTPSSTIGDFVCRKPMQCAITEYICYPPNIPLDDAPDELLTSDLKPSDINITERGIEIQSQTYCYEKFTPGGDESHKRGQALDILLFGETLEEHEQAWGGYRFVGKVSRDGRIVLKREPKQFEDALLGTWCFDGYLRYGSAFVGQWRSGTEPESIHGIFSMRKNNDA